jgi:hypothetical protein
VTVMKKVMALLVMVSGMAVAQFRYPAYGSVNDRQHGRIAAGVANGGLTNREAAYLRNRQRDVQRDIRRDRYDGGGFSTRERRDAQCDRRQLSNEIYRQRHDGQRRRW